MICVNHNKKTSKLVDSLDNYRIPLKKEGQSTLGNIIAISMRARSWPGSLELLAGKM